MKPSIYEYENYRLYLQAMYNHLKQVKPAFSYRFFSKQAGFKAPNFLKLVIEGKRNLTEKSIPKFSKALSHTPQEAEFFSHIVYFTQAPDNKKRGEYYEQMTRCRRYRELRMVSHDQYEYYSHWYYSAVRELVNCDTFREDPVWISSHLQPSITIAQAAKALQLLERLGMIERDEEGHLRQTNRNITTGDEVAAMAVFNFHHAMLTRAQAAMSDIPAEERDLSAVTFGVHADKITEFKKLLSQFRKDLLAMVGSETGSTNRIYQLNMQLFPLSKRISSGGKK